MPIYSVAFELYENGISRALTLDYNDFVLRGDMSLLEIKDTKPCAKASGATGTIPGADPAK